MHRDPVLLVFVCSCISLFDGLNDPFADMTSHDVLYGSINLISLSIPMYDWTKHSLWYIWVKMGRYLGLWSIREPVQIMPWLHCDPVLLVFVCSWCSLWLDKLNLSLSIPMYEDTPPWRWVLWHHAVAAHHWTGQSLNLPWCTSVVMNTTMPSNLRRYLAVMMGLLIQCWLDLEVHFRQSTTVNCVEMHSQKLELLTWC